MKKGTYEVLVRDIDTGKAIYKPIDGYIFTIDGYSFGCTNKIWKGGDEYVKKSWGWDVTHLKTGLKCTNRTPHTRAEVIPLVEEMMSWYKDHNMPVDEEWTDEDTKKWCGGIYR